MPAGSRTILCQAWFARRLWEGDGVEQYFDARRDGNFRSQAWPTNASPGAVHCYWVGLKGTNVQPRFCLRPGFLEAIPKIGVEVGARRSRNPNGARPYRPQLFRPVK